MGTLAQARGDNVFISCSYKNKGTHARFHKWFTKDSFLYLVAVNMLALKRFITSCTLLYRVCTRGEGARCVLKEHSPFDTPCQGWATPVLCTTFSHQIKKKHLHTQAHTPPALWKMVLAAMKALCTTMEPYGTANLDAFSDPLQQWRRWKACRALSDWVFFCKHRGLLAFSLPFIW